MLSTYQCQLDRSALDSLDKLVHLLYSIHWSIPSIDIDKDRDIVLEWQLPPHKKLTIVITPQRITYSKIIGNVKTNGTVDLEDTEQLRNLFA